MKLASRTPLMVACATAFLATFGIVASAASAAADAHRPGRGGDGTVQEKTAEPTTLTISLEGAGQSGADVTVSEEAKVSAAASLAGTNAATARGAVSYKVYSDSGCVDEVAPAGTRRVRQGEQSRAIRVGPGTYYWQATYSGDATNQASVSACGTAIETVTGDAPSPPCTATTGEMRVLTSTGYLGVREGLSTDLTARERLFAWWNGKHRLRLTHLLEASCVTRKRLSVFRGWGEAKLDGATGYFVRFAIRVSTNGEQAVRLHVRNSAHELLATLVGFPVPVSEVIH